MYVSKIVFSERDDNDDDNDDEDDDDDNDDNDDEDDDDYDDDYDGPVTMSAICRRLVLAGVRRRKKRILEQS